MFDMCWSLVLHVWHSLATFSICWHSLVKVSTCWQSLNEINKFEFNIKETHENWIKQHIQHKHVDTFRVNFLMTICSKPVSPQFYMFCPALQVAMRSVKYVPGASSTRFATSNSYLQTGGAMLQTLIRLAIITCSTC